MMVPLPQDDPQDREPGRERTARDFHGPHGPEHEAALQALLERDSGFGEALEWSEQCEQCRDVLARLRELGALLDEAAVDRRRTLDSAQMLRNFGDDMVASFVRNKLAETEPARRPVLRAPSATPGPVEQPVLATAARAARPASERAATTANGPRWQRAWAPWVVTAAGVALLVGWWLRSILPDGTPQGTDVSLSTDNPVVIYPEGPVDNYDKFVWGFGAPLGGSLVLRIWDTSRADSAELIHTIRLDPNQTEWLAGNVWKGPAPKSISWEVEALDSTSEPARTTGLVPAQLRPR